MTLLSVFKSNNRDNEFSLPMPDKTDRDNTVVLYPKSYILDCE
jgi:hypothetical protein